MHEVFVSSVLINSQAFVNVLKCKFLQQIYFEYNTNNGPTK